MISAALVLVAATTTMAYELAREVPQDLAQRSVMAGGGFALIVGSGNTCPSDTTQCNGWNCCPNALTCHEGVAGTIAASCCPPSSSCLTALVSEPFCADNTWLLYNTKGNDYSDFFCCQSGQIGLTDGSCASNQTSVASSLLASFVTPGVAVATSSGSTSAATNSPSTTSTPSSGSASNTAGSASTSTMVSGASPTSTVINGEASSSPTANSSSDTNNSSGLSTGAKIGIGVGVGLGLIILALLIYLLVLLNRIQRRQRSREAFAPLPPPETMQGGGMENPQFQSTPASSGYPVQQEYRGYDYPPKQEYTGSPYPAKQEIISEPVVEAAGRDPPAQLE